MTQAIASQEGVVLADRANCCVWTRLAVLRAGVASEGSQVLKGSRKAGLVTKVIVPEEIP